MLTFASIVFMLQSIEVGEKDEGDWKGKVSPVKK